MSTDRIASDSTTGSDIPASVSTNHWSLLSSTSSTSSLRSSHAPISVSISFIGLLHKAIRDGDFDVVHDMVLEHGPDLMTQPNTVGWTGLHFCATSTDISWEDWKWILEQLPIQPNLWLTLRTDIGHSSVYFFFRRFLCPLDWQQDQVQEDAKALRESITMVLHNEDLLRDLKECLSGDEDETNMTSDGALNTISNNHHICRIVPFWTRMLLLLKPFSQPTVLHALATTACPDLVAQLAMKLDPSAPSQRDTNGDLPLHICCRNTACVNALTTTTSTTTGATPTLILPCLLEFANQLDGGVDVDDEGIVQFGKRHGRLPLHIALSSGKAWEEGIVDLWNAFPLYGGTLDSATALPAFLVAALPWPSSVMTQKAITIASDASFGLYRFLPLLSQQHAIQQATVLVEQQHLNTIYNLLRASPNAIQCCCYCYNYMQWQQQETTVRQGI